MPRCWPIVASAGVAALILGFMRFLWVFSVLNRPAVALCYGRSSNYEDLRSMPFTETLNQINPGLNPVRGVAPAVGDGLRGIHSAVLLPANYLTLMFSAACSDLLTWRDVG